MHLGRVIGRVVATQRTPELDGERLLLVRVLDEHGEHPDQVIVACDVVDSGPGDLVHVCDGRESTLALRRNFVPIDATIVGHVEEFAHTGPGPQVHGSVLGDAPGDTKAGKPKSKATRGKSGSESAGKSKSARSGKK
ncbi:MAG: hypothetical protein DHS20C15_23270 [Planctomycetota bacterium]|nr:MAG: hypothetical protein DHS20C15_23270 [Planctomycetota bacterium]